MKTMKRISIENYIATNNPRELNSILSKMGIPKAKSVVDASNKIRYLMSKGEEDVIKEISKIDTPYRRLILSSIEQKQEQVSNACGCSSFSSEETSNCDGKKCKCNYSFDDSEKNKKEDSKKENDLENKKERTFESFVPYVGVGLLLILTTAVLVKS
jgi:hypothetical protein